MLGNVFKTENLRLGTKRMFKILKSQNHQIYIYTTSYRSIFKLRTTFLLSGLYPDKIINQKINSRILKKNNCSASKNPNLFDIDIHVDDSEGVR